MSFTDARKDFSSGLTGTLWGFVLMRLFLGCFLSLSLMNPLDWWKFNLASIAIPISLGATAAVLAKNLQPRNLRMAIDFLGFVSMTFTELVGWLLLDRAFPNVSDVYIHRVLRNVAYFIVLGILTQVLILLGYQLLGRLHNKS